MNIKLKMVENKKGFTLIELLVVIAIIGILVTLVVAAINPLRQIQNSQDVKMRADLQQVKAAMQLYYNDCKKYPPTSGVTFGSALGANPSSGPDGASGTCDDNTVYMRQVPANFAGSTYVYAPDATLGNYTITAKLNNSNTDDNNTLSKCGLSPSGTVNYAVCND